MGQIKVAVKLSAAKSIAEVSWFIESKGMVATAEKFSEYIYDFIESLADDRKSYKKCKDPKRALLGFNVSHITRTTLSFLLKPNPK